LESSFFRSGGALEKMSIVMLGVGPYITATIILQLLTMIFPQLEKMYKEEGEAGRQKMINALRRLQTASTEPLPDEMAAFGISGGAVKEWFASHPPLEQRIAVLQQQ